MENSKGLKLVVLLVAILGIWNTYRIEVNNESLNLTAQSDTLEVSENDLSARIAILEAEIDNLKKTVNALQNKIDRLSSSSPSTGNKPSTTKATGSASTPKVEAKVRVENRYVQNKVILPQVKSSCTGVVVIEVKMNQLGMVGSATVASGTTITDEDIIYSCKEAALKTDFAYNPEAPQTSIGTITYTFN